MLIIKRIAGTAFLLSLSFYSGLVSASYGKRLCNSEGYECITVKRGQTWSILFPDDGQRTIVKKVNRMNTELRPRMRIAVPSNLENLSLMDLAPLPNQIEPPGLSTVKVDLGKLAWGAYTASGDLINWGPVSGGKNYCPDIRRGCRTVTGHFTVQSKGGPGCVSSKFPVGKGGAPMPYCMFFKGGFAMHASTMVPGANASHGCVRMFLEDARWLNREFVEIGSTRVKVVP